MNRKRKSSGQEGALDAGPYGPLFVESGSASRGPSEPLGTQHSLLGAHHFLKRPLVFLDIEATGLDPVNDRIVEISLVRLSPDSPEKTWTQRVQPGMPIPPEATAIHGITDQDVREAPFFKKIAGQVLEFLEGADLGGYNIARFDVPMLSAELERCGVTLKTQERKIVDVMKIFHKKESRDLAAAYQFYCQKKLEGHHGAEADTQAVKEVFLAQLNRYPDLPRSVDALHDFCRANDGRFVDSEGKLSWRYGAAHFTFGKYKSRSLEEIANVDREYLAWLLESDKTSPEFAGILRSALDGEFPKK